MDRISQLPDELLLRIFSLLPSTKDVVTTMVLSKRWQFLWMLVPKLVFDDSYGNIEYKRFSRFVDRSLFLHEAPVIETLRFKLGRICGSGDIQVWIRAADKCCVRKLTIEIDTCSSSKTPVRLPRSLYSGGCRMLVTLKLSNALLVDDVTCPISFPFLKKLSLVSMKYTGDEFFNRLLSSCPVLEDLVLEQCPDDNLTILSVRVPTLKRLSLHKSDKIDKEDNSHGFVIDAPSLEYLKIVDYSFGFRIIENDMRKIVIAILDISYPQTKQLLGSLTSAKRLYLCLPTSKDAYPVGTIFYSLVHLKICTCETEWLNVLIQVLRDSPNLKYLRIQQCHKLRPDEPRPLWNETRLVPEYLLSNLETMEWVKYEGTKEEKQVVAFILRIACCLKKATIISTKSIDHNKKLEMLHDFPLSSRRSPSCLLAFQWSFDQQSK